MSVRKNSIVSMLMLAALVLARAEGVSVHDLRCEYRVDPLGIDIEAPRLSWVLESDARGDKQTAYRVLVASSLVEFEAETGDFWDSGKIVTDQSASVMYAGKTLSSDADLFWKVRVWGKDGKASEWSEPAKWSMGLLNEEDWQAHWIGLEAGEIDRTAAVLKTGRARWVWCPEANPAKEAPGAECFFRKVIECDPKRKVREAVVLVAADDAADVYVNGVFAGKHEGHKQMASFEIGQHLQAGPNVIAIKAGNASPGPAGLLAEIVVSYQSGKPLRCRTDATWNCVRQVGSDWKDLSADDKTWKSAMELGENGVAPWGKVRYASAQPAPGPLLRKSFQAGKRVRRATVYVCGLGYYELRINGTQIGDYTLAPDYTRYDRRVIYNTFDVTDDIRRGENVLGVMLGHGWYDMHTRATWNFDRAPWRGNPTLLLRLNLEYEDGSRASVVSDASWQGITTGPIVFDSIRNGETYDARREKTGWDMPGYRERWPGVKVMTAPAGVLHAQQSPPVKVMITIKPVSVDEVRPGVFRFDFGQNMSGRSELRVSGPAGTEIKLVHRERLNPDGSLFEENGKYVFSGPFQTDTYILKGKGEEVWSSRFGYHGFRYVEVEGWPGTPTLENLRAHVVHTAFETVGTFRCSNPLLNQIQTNTLWSYLGNFVSIPTDCPHREKNGWTGDAHLAAETGLMNFRSAAAYAKWMNDLKDEQRSDGSYAAIIPTSGWGYNIGPSWDCAYPHIVWYLYQYCGDERVVEEHYENLKRYMDFLQSRAKGHIVSYKLGDWCPPLGADNSSPCPVYLTSTGYYYKDAQLMARMAALLNKDEDASKYNALAELIAEALNKKAYDSKTGLYDGSCQTSQLTALYQGFAVDREKVLDQLVKMIDKADGHLDCGILGTKYLLRVLSECGRTDLAYRIATQTTFPSWGYWIEQGATTLWERWDGKNSQNHIMFGDISAWAYANLGGIAPDKEQPGFKHVIMHPVPVEGLDWVKAEHTGPYGRIVSHWKIENGVYIHEVTVPVSTAARVYVPDTGTVTESGVAVGDAVGVKFSGRESGCQVYSVESGTYRFEVPFAACSRSKPAIVGEE
ncbi:MAG: family 78 glycoside hydrolase catalytic domain [Phycisphaerae bacterium]|nr:family 78 glycoside hydrolase catalytic domain [Phycisphaerae bacterium]